MRGFIPEPFEKGGDNLMRLFDDPEEEVVEDSGDESTDDSGEGAVAAA